MKYSDKKFESLFEKLNGEQIGKLMAVYFKESAMRDFLFDHVIGAIPEEDSVERQTTYRTMQMLIKKL